MLSIIIPVYNGEKYIESAIKSVLKQPYRNLEIVVVNDCSTDKTKVIVEKMSAEDDRIRLINQSSNKGVSSARNKGIAESCGEYIVFLDCDDVWLPGVITDEKMHVLDCEQYDIVSFGYYETNENITRGKLISTADGVISGGADSWGKVWKHNNSFFYKRELLIKNGIVFDPYIHNEDERFRTLCVYFAGKILSIHEPLFCYRNHSASVTHSTNVKQAIETAMKGYIYVKQQYGSENRIIEYCDTMIYIDLFEIFLEIMKERNGKQKYASFIHDNGLEKENNETKLKIDQERCDILKNVEKYPRIYYLKCLIRGVLVKIIKRNKQMIKVYENKKYPYKMEV